MKPIAFLLSISFVFVFTLTRAQQKTALHSNGTVTIFDGQDHFKDAYNAAVDGDTIYLPGGLITSYETLNKRLYIFGAGYNTDSASATGITQIQGNWDFNSNADSSIIEGIHITGQLRFYNVNSSTNWIEISRCRMNSVSIDGWGTNSATNNTFRECVIDGGFTLRFATYTNITNCIIGGDVQSGTYSYIANNIFLYQSTSSSARVLYNVDNSLIVNNIFLKSSSAYGIMRDCDHNTFSNNVITYTPTVGTNTFTNNYYDVTPIDSIFVNQSGSQFDFVQDYHLISGNNLIGNDGSPVGIYGGIYPFKDGMLPRNPHIRMKAVDAQTQPNGDLNIQFEVGAQDQ